MKVLHTGTFDVNAGGPAMSTYYTLKGLRAKGVEAELFMYPLSTTGKMIGYEVPVHFARKPWDHKLLYSVHYKKDLLRLGEYDIYHAQGVWQYPTYVLADIARKKRKPYLITPRGMLYPQDIRKSNELFKNISLKYRLLNDLNYASCIHVTCEDEMVHCRNLGVIAPIAVIPNPIEIKEYEETKKDGIFRLGFLGRLHPRKNVESLIRAWYSLGSKTNNAELLIIGGGDEKYEKQLREEVKQLALKNVRFTGFLSGQEKMEAIASLSVLAMPSEFENLGNVILEGLVRRIPCIATKGTPWKELNTCSCGWWVEYNQQAITAAVESALNTSEEELFLMGEHGKQLMIDHYSVQAVAGKMKELYEWLLNGNGKPNTMPFLNIVL